MSQVVKTFLGLFFLLLEAMAGMGIAAAGVQTGAAQNYHSDVVRELECSDFNPSVMEACKTQAGEAGYSLQINPLVYNERNQVEMAEVILEYQYAVKTLNMQSARQIRGIAG